MSDLTMNQYQHAAAQTAAYHPSDALVYTSLGLTEEAGEAAGKIAKLVRKRGLSEAKRAAMGNEEIMSEVSDVLWMIAMLSSTIGFTLQDVAQHNLDKLQDRAQRGVIIGEGDAR